MIIDAGVLIAAADRDEESHEAVRDLMGRAGEKIVPEPVIVEADQLILDRLGVVAELAFLESLEGRWFSIEAPTREDRRRARELVAQHRDVRIGYVDAAIVAIAERLHDHVIATLDRRHFSIIRPRHVEAFEIVP